MAIVVDSARFAVHAYDLAGTNWASSMNFRNQGSDFPKVTDCVAVVAGVSNGSDSVLAYSVITHQWSSVSVRVEGPDSIKITGCMIVVPGLSNGSDSVLAFNGFTGEWNSVSARVQNVQLLSAPPIIEVK